MAKKPTKLQTWIQSIDWENWTHMNGKHWDICQVLYCKLDWVRENLTDDELIETIDRVQEIITRLDEKQLAKLLK